MLGFGLGNVEARNHEEIALNPTYAYYCYFTKNRIVCKIIPGVSSLLMLLTN